MKDGAAEAKEGEKEEKQVMEKRRRRRRRDESWTGMKKNKQLQWSFLRRRRTELHPAATVACLEASQRFLCRGQRSRSLS